MSTPLSELLVGIPLTVGDRPKEFVKQPVSSVSDDESEDESNVGKLPPSDDDSDA